jgi:hypothetical protein
MEESAKTKSDMEIILVPCADTGRVGCRIVQRAVELAAAQTPEVIVSNAQACPRGGRRFVVAVDASRNCQPSETLRECGARPSAVVSAPAVLSRTGNLRPGVDVAARVEDLARTLAAAIEESLEGALGEIRERQRYRDEMAPIMSRFDGMWNMVEALPAPNGRPSEREAKRVELLGKRARNLFVRFDEVVPPAQWTEPHDLFQDAMLCVAYACEGWASGDAVRWDQNLEKAEVQIRPLLRRLDQ